VPVAFPSPALPTRGSVPAGAFGAIEERTRSHTLPFMGRAEGKSRALLPRLVAAFLLLTFLLAAPAVAREEITSFATDITLMADGTVDVTETIEVTAEGNEIRRGIYRDIPTTLINDDGSRLRSDLDVISVTRNGNPEPYAIEGFQGGTRVRIGDADVFLNYGSHRYVIRYTMTRMGRFFPDHDELFWNATGNYWNFFIRSARATVTLPDGARITELVGYTGKPGSQEQAVTVTRQTDTRAIFVLKRPLSPGEGMSVAVAFEKGVLAEPDTFRQVLYWISDHRDLILPLFAVGLVLLYNYFAWDAVGRDPPKGTIIPLFHAPKGFSPALVHYIHEMGWKKSGWTAFTASIFDLGVKGLVIIDNVGKSLGIKVTGKQPDEKLPPGEKLLFDYLTSEGSVTVDTKTGPKIHQKRGEFTAALEAENRQVYFKNNVAYVVGGAAVALICLGSLVLLGVLDFVWLIGAVVAGVAIGLFTSVFSSIWSGGGFSKFIVLVWLAIGGFNLFSGITNFADFLRFDTAVVAAASIVLITIVFAILLRAPTVQGRKVMDQIEGFRMYLDTAEKNRLNFTDEPQMTAKRFEAILPYAIALGVEKPWSERFEGELARHAVPDADENYSPGWYSGRHWSTSSGGFSNTVSSVATGMSAAMIAAQPASSSGSGFSGGGGGGSGGGGGGGGGGGW
jgi:uncharacterized membrane protein YgcG